MAKTARDSNALKSHAFSMISTTFEFLSEGQWPSYLQSAENWSRVPLRQNA